MKKNTNAKSSTLLLAVFGVLTLGAGTAFANNAGLNARDDTSGQTADSVDIPERKPMNRNANTNRSNAYTGTQQSGQKSQFKTSSKADVRKVQKVLADKGLYNGPIDGIIGTRTLEAVRQFQDDNDLASTGRLNMETLDRLGQDESDWSWRSQRQFSE